MKFGFFTDSHFSTKNESRLDNTLQVSIKKLKQALRWFKKNKCDFVICGGDLFDRHRELNFDLLYSVFETIKSQSLKIYYIMGNHDEQGYRWQTVDKSSAGFIEKISGGKLILIKDKLEIKGCNLIACHAGQDIEEITNSVEKSNKPNIVIAHCLLSNDMSIGNISLNKITNTNIDLVLSGDLHDGYEYQKNDYGINCYNPGSLIRLSVSDKDRKPKVAMFDISDFMGERFVSITEKVLKHKSSEEIFPEKNKKIEIEKDVLESKDYITSFKEFKSKSKDIFEVLENIGIKENIDKDILEMIKIYKDKKSNVE